MEFGHEKLHTAESPEFVALSCRQYQRAALCLNAMFFG
jgi:hypothetical protein